MAATITPEQKAQLEAVREKWIRIADSTEPGDPKRLKELICKAYEMAGLSPPYIWIEVPSPIHGAIVAAYLSSITIDDDGTVHLPKGKPQVGPQLYRCGYGSQDTSWFAYYDTFSVFNVEEVEKLRPLMEMTEHVGWWWPLKDAVITTPKPSLICRDERGRLHSETGPALSYGKFFSIWAIHGVAVSRQIVESPETLTVGDVIKETNDEVRRIILQRMGDRFYMESAAEILDEDVDGAGQPRRLMKIVLQTNQEFSNDEPVVACEVTCPSTGHKYFRRVPPNITTCRAAIAWSAGVDTDRYSPIIEA